MKIKNKTIASSNIIKYHPNETEMFQEKGEESFWSVYILTNFHEWKHDNYLRENNFPCLNYRNWLRANPLQHHPAAAVNSESKLMLGKS